MLKSLEPRKRLLKFRPRREDSPQEQADGIIRKLWERMGKRRTITDGRIFVGGRGRRNEANADRLAKACIQATGTLKNPDPQLSLRFYKGMNSELWELAEDAIGEGCTYPVLYNDEKDFKISRSQVFLDIEFIVYYTECGTVHTR